MNKCICVNLFRITKEAVLLFFFHLHKLPINTTKQFSIKILEIQQIDSLRTSNHTYLTFSDWRHYSWCVGNVPWKRKEWE